MQEFLAKLDEAEARSQEIERQETVDFYLRELREKIRADSNPMLMVARVTDGLSTADFSELPLNHRARFKESLGLLRNLLGGNPANYPDPITPTATALLALFDAGVLDRP
jgi:citrate synthase